MARIYKTPGVYIEEKSAFPNSVVPIATAVPAFIGYTERAERDKKSLLLQPTRISSFGEYLMFFGEGPTTKFTIEGAENAPYKLTIKEGRFTLHSQMKMFFSNGGSDCYIVSVGSYTDENGNANSIDVDQLKKGIEPLLKVMEPTMIVVPEAVHAAVGTDTKEDDVKSIYTIYQDMLKHCGVEMQNRFAIMDVWMNSENIDDPEYNMRDDIELFRDGIGMNSLEWGATYFPWLHTTAVSAAEVSLLNIDNLGEEDDIKPLPPQTFDDEGEISNRDEFKSNFLNPAEKTDSLAAVLNRSLNEDVFNGVIKSDLANRAKTSLLTDLVAKDLKNDTSKIQDLNQGLLTISPLYKSIMRDVRKQLNLLPPSAAIAGVYAMVDNQVGVFKSPANVGIGSVISPGVNISSEQQEDMNVPINGKAVNAIRTFPGKGVLVWGARTLDGNSQDWRYISVRRTVIYIEQSIKAAAEPYVFEPNTASTWSNMKALIANFLTNEWQSGALAGATAEDAFSVDVGLGSTMTPVDILDGYMRIVVKIAVTRPAEFIVIAFEQKMQQS